ncbi:MAG: sigma-70 family RNA polymerase sigma factor [Actinomycetota bacterium]|nr:sigma-70 family RNA polymerase sigma factor [Actinomycetota bacterium]
MLASRGEREKGMVTVKTIESGTESRAVVRELLASYAETGDRALRDHLVEIHRGLARWAAAKFVNRGEPFDDLEQVAMMGLLKALDRYDPAQGHEFSTYAVSTMFGELRRHLRDHAWKIHLPRSLHDRHAAIRKTISVLTQELGRSPTLNEVAARAGTSLEQVVEAMEVGTRARPTSLESASVERESSLSEAQAAMTGVEERADMAALLNRLSPRARQVVRMRFVDEMSQAEIGRSLGVSQMQISRILSQSLARLRAWAAEGPGGVRPADPGSAGVPARA